MKVQITDVSNQNTEIKALVEFESMHVYFNDMKLAYKVKEALERFDDTKQILTELHHLVEFTNPAFKAGNSIYDRSKKLITQ